MYVFCTYAQIGAVLHQQEIFNTNMAQTKQEPEITVNNFKKCGEISASTFEDKREFYLNCEFCQCTYLQLNNFIQHIYEEHLAQLPSRLFKQERTTTPFYSQDSRDCYDIINEVEEHMDYNVEMLEVQKESKDPHFSSNDFETVILSPNEVDVKEESLQNINNGDLRTHQTKEHNDIDVTSDDEMLSDYEIPEEKTKSRGKKAQNINHLGASDVNEAKKALEASLSSSKPSTRHVKPTDSIIDVSQRIILAEIYKKHACLWDEKDIAYRFTNRRDAALKSIREEFNEKTQLNLIEYDFLKEVLYLRKICSDEKRKKVACKRKSKEHKTSCTYYSYIEYLEADVAPYVCSICGEQYRGPVKLKVHEATHDGSLPFKCPVCGSSYQIVHYLTQHMRRHHARDDLQYHCEVCNKAFISSSEVVLHMRTHTGERPYVCYICGLGYKSSSSLIGHIDRHKKDKRYKCEICSKSYYTLTKLTIHKKTHSDVCEYICKICEKGFKTHKHLKQHTLIHESVKRYVCKICEKRFAQYAGLSCHMKSHGPNLLKTIDNNLK